MFDISAAGNITVTILPKDGKPVTFAPADFSDAGSPVRFGREEVANAQIDMNGDLFSSTLRRPMTVELYPLPNSIADIKFEEWLFSQWEKGQAEAAIASMTIKWTFYRGNNQKTSSLTYVDGAVTTGSFGNDPSAEGRFTTNPYLFRFAKVKSEYDKAPEKTNKKKKQPKVRINPKKVGATYYFGSTANQYSQMARGI